MKIYKLLPIAAMAFIFASCSEDSPEPGNATPVKPTTGAVVICDGYPATGIPGSVTTYDFKTSTATLNAFSQANGRYLGTSADDALVAGDYLFIVSTNENMVEITDKNTLKSVKRINMTETFGAHKGEKPRSLLVADDKLFISTFAGYVCTYDYKNLTPSTTYKAGSYPEGIAVLNGKLYVANSGYGIGLNPSLSVIDLKTGEGKEITSENLLNPRYLYTVAGKLFIIDGGEYDMSWNQTKTHLYAVEIPDSGDGEYKFRKICDATLGAASGKNIVICSAPWHTPAVVPSYAIYNVESGVLTALSDITVDSPAFVGIDPSDEDIFVGSYKLNPATGYAAYDENGYVNIYSAKEGYAKSGAFECGVGPRAITFSL